MERDPDELEFLSSAATALSELDPGEDVFQFVAKQLASLAPESLVITTCFEPNGTAVVRAAEGPPDMLRMAREITGEPVGHTLLMDDDARRTFAEGKLARVEGGMHQLTFRRWPTELARRLEERLGIAAVYGQSFSRKGDFLGAVSFLSRTPTLAHGRLIEVYVRLAAVAIQRRRVEAQLRKSECLFRMLAENSRDVVFRLRTRPPAVEYVSPATTSLSGYTPEEIYADARLGAPCLYPTQWVSGAAVRAVPTEPVVAQCRRRDGAHVWMEQSFTPIRGADGEIVAVEGASRDITNRKEAEDAVIEADRRKTEFLAILSHELRNPLGAIRNALYVLERVDAGSEQAKRTLSAMGRQITQLTRLVDDLLDVTRITRGKVRLQRERLDLSELVRATLEDHRATFARATVDVEVRVAPNVLVYGDRTRISQVIDNLLQNAAKFTPPGGRASISVRVDRERRESVLRVQNTGPTIPPDIAASLFEPFVQADRTLDRSKGGLGLGLALVRGLVDLHGGSVHAESDDVEGTVLTIRLPLAATAPEVAACRAAAEPTHGTPRRVLVIEDNVDAAETLRTALQLHGHTVAIASSGPEGIAAARALAPDVVFCDIGLPVMNGYEVARAIRADPDLKRLAFVALSGYASPEDVARARDAGFDRHVPKPPSIETLERVMSELTEPHESRA